MPNGRLKILWDQADAFLASEQRWEAVWDASDSRNSLDVRAALIAIEGQVSREIAELDYRHGDCGITLIHDPAALAEMLGWDEAQLATHETAFVEDATLVVPWPTTRAVVKRLVAIDPGPALTYLDREEREARHEAIQCRYSQLSRRDPERYITPEDCVEFDNEYGLPIREALRRFIPAELQERHDELAALRIEVRRLGNLVERAITTLRSSGHTHAAEQLRIDLGIAVDTLPGRSP